MVCLNTLIVENLKDASFSEFLNLEQFEANDAQHDALKEKLIGR
jgi:hypothetical protein